MLLGKAGSQNRCEGAVHTTNTHVREAGMETTQGVQVSRLSEAKLSFTHFLPGSVSWHRVMCPWAVTNLVWGWTPRGKMKSASQVTEEGDWKVGAGGTTADLPREPSWYNAQSTD